MLVSLLLAAIVLGALTVCTVTYWLFWTGTAGTDHMTLLRARSDGHLWRWGAAAFASSLASQVACVLLYPAFLFQKYWLAPADPDAPGAKPPVLFVHGYTHTASAWLFFAAWFRRAGYRDLHAITYNSLTRTFPEIVDQLETEVARILRERPGRPVLLVGHSLGGLAIRDFLNTSPLAARVGAAVTLGTPHQGSTLAGLGMNALARTLQFKGPLIRAIESRDTPPTAPCLSLYSPLDNMVLPPEALRIHKPGWTEQEADPVCHIGMLYHHPTATTVLDFLNSTLNTPAAND